MDCGAFWWVLGGIFFRGLPWNMGMGLTVV